MKRLIWWVSERWVYIKVVSLSKNMRYDVPLVSTSRFKLFLFSAKGLFDLPGAGGRYTGITGYSSIICPNADCRSWFSDDKPSQGVEISWGKVVGDIHGYQMPWSVRQNTVVKRRILCTTEKLGRRIIWTGQWAYFTDDIKGRLEGDLGGEKGIEHEDKMMNADYGTTSRKSQIILPVMWHA